MFIIIVSVLEQNLKLRVFQLSRFLNVERDLCLPLCFYFSIQVFGFFIVRVSYINKRIIVCPISL
jgi:hypothetical protein